jgi:hypothetical protein
MSVSENERDRHICATAYLWVLVTITVALTAAISAAATSMIEITFLVMLASTPLVFLLYVRYWAKVMGETRVGYMAGGTGSWEETWEIFPNLTSVHACILAGIWPIAVYLLRTYLPLPAPIDVAYLQVANPI